MSHSVKSKLKIFVNQCSYLQSKERSLLISFMKRRSVDRLKQNL